MCRLSSGLVGQSTALKGSADFSLLSSPLLSLPAALLDRPFYEEWWFLLIMALIGLILILVLVFTLLLRGQSAKYKACSTGLSAVLKYATFQNQFFLSSVVPLTFNRHST